METTMAARQVRVQDLATGKIRRLPSTQRAIILPEHAASVTGGVEARIVGREGGKDAAECRWSSRDGFGDSARGVALSLGSLEDGTSAFVEPPGSTDGEWCEWIGVVVENEEY
jgi:hypothetical protein